MPAWSWENITQSDSRGESFASDFINKKGVILKINKKIYALLLLSLLFSLLMACGLQGITLTGADQDAVLAFSEAKSDNLLAGMNANDYAAFSRDFDQAMLNAMTQTEFEKLKMDRDAKFGLYVSRVLNSVVQTGDFVAVVYDAKFEKDDAVTVRIVFCAADPHQVSGLWFNK